MRTAGLTLGDRMRYTLFAGALPAELEGEAWTLASRDHISRDEKI